MPNRRNASPSHSARSTRSQDPVNFSSITLTAKVIDGEASPLDTAAIWRNAHVTATSRHTSDTCRRAGERTGRCYRRHIVMIRHTPNATRWCAVTALAITLCLIGFGSSWGMLDDHAHTAHEAHALAASPHAGVVNHAHIDDGSGPSMPDPSAEAALPRAATAFAAMALLAGMAVANGRRGHESPATVRGPPCRSPAAASGQRTLLELCIARR